MKTCSFIDNYFIEGLLESEGALLPPQAERQAGGQGPRGGRGEGSGRVPVAVHQVVQYSTLHYSTVQHTAQYTTAVQYTTTGRPSATSRPRRTRRRGCRPRSSRASSSTPRKQVSQSRSRWWYSHQLLLQTSRACSPSRPSCRAAPTSSSGSACPRPPGEQLQL